MGALLWAQRYVDAGNGAFAGLLSGLQEWYRRNLREVGKDSALRLMAEAPDLAYSLYHHAP